MNTPFGPFVLLPHHFWCQHGHGGPSDKAACLWRCLGLQGQGGASRGSPGVRSPSGRCFQAAVGEGPGAACAGGTVGAELPRSRRGHQYVSEVPGLRGCGFCRRTEISIRLIHDALAVHVHNSAAVDDTTVNNVMRWHSCRTAVLEWHPVFSSLFAMSASCSMVAVSWTLPDALKLAILSELMSIHPKVSSICRDATVGGRRRPY